MSAGWVGLQFSRKRTGRKTTRRKTKGREGEGTGGREEKGELAAYSVNDFLAF